MKVSLRKANALQEALNEVIKARPKADSEVDVLNYDMWKTEINIVQTRYFDDVRSKLQMVEARFVIRNEIANHNALSGVSDLLTELAQVESMITTIQRWVLRTEIRPKDEVLEKKRSRRMAQVERADYDGYVTMDVSVIGKGDHDHWTEKVQELRRTKASINDQLLELNIRTEIELSPQVEKVLKQENLI
tara:strand:- start:914 stop:1483 length:570 start_codon:yes stop_codon:yes gene_type:complete